MPTKTEIRLIRALRLIADSKLARYYFEEPEQMHPTLFIKYFGTTVTIGKLRVRVYYSEFRDDDEDDVLPDQDDQVVEAWYDGIGIFFAVAPWPEWNQTSIYKRPQPPPPERFAVRINSEMHFQLLCLTAVSLAALGSLHSAPD